MEPRKDHIGMLDLMIRPAFCVKENKIVQCNAAAEALLLFPGMELLPLLLTGREEYAAFSGGCLYLKLALTANGCGATVTKQEGQDVFVLDMESDDSQLRILALAARELRDPLAGLMISADRLSQEDATREQVARLNRSLYQMLRIIGNMSDAGNITASTRQETTDVTALFHEILEKARTLLEHTDIQLHWKPLSEEILCLADREQLERAVWNILSNAAKFTPKGGCIDVSLSRQGRMLRLSVCDNGSGITEAVRSNIFSRYLRQPGIEDSRFGLGLGLVLVRSAAANHGGTILIDQPDGAGARITMTMAIRQNPDTLFRSPVMRVDYAGERDHGLLEFSESLPVFLYEKES